MLRIKHHLVPVAAAVAALGFFGTSFRSDAAVVPLGTSGWTASWDSSLDPFLSVVVDGQNANSVFIQKIVQFVGPPPGGLSPIAVTFTQTAPGAVPNIVIEDEVVTNQTGVPWLDFHMDITDSGDAAFNPALTAASGGPPPIGFSIAPFTTASFGTSASGPNTTLDIGGGVIAPGATWFPGAGPNGDGSLFITTNPHPTAPFTVFTLKERPTVPEPASLSVVALGALTLLRRGRGVR
jgi:hypothetical protein